MQIAPKRSYRGHDKHKRRPTRGVKGSFCPEWTHDNPGHTPLRIDVFAFPWSASVAQQLLDESQIADGESTIDSEPALPRYATRRGMAFKAVPSNDGTWHGYPVPWEQVPGGIKDSWLRVGRVSRRDILKYSLRNIQSRGSVVPNEWAMENDSE